MSKRNRRDNIDLSSRPEPPLSKPEPEALAERKEPKAELPHEPKSEPDDPLNAAVAEFELMPAYPCPVCYPKLNGIGIVQRTMSITVFCKCNRCSWLWSASRRFDARPVNCILVVPKPRPF